MTNDELKKKICDIIAPYVSAYGDDERIADALIAAGIGDVTEWKEKAKKHRVQVLPDGTIKQLYSDEEVEDIARQRDEYKHRAEVAERAVYNLAYGEWQREGARRAICEKYAPSTAQDYLDRAEKELAEENDGKKEV